MRRARIVVQGVARPQGSKTTVVKNGRSIVLDGKGPGRARFHAWRKAVREVATDELDPDRFPIARPTPVAVRVLFECPRPGYHYRTGAHAGELKPHAPYWNPTQNPGDVDKLLRAILDGLAGVAFQNDGQVADAHASTFYGDRPAATIYVVELDPCGYVPFAGVPLELLAEGDLARVFDFSSRRPAGTFEELDELETDDLEAGS